MLSYDAAGRLTIKVDDSLTTGEEYYYDNLGRLRADSAINAPSPPPGCTPPQIVGDNGVNCLSGDTWTVGPGHAFSYDSAGNRTDQGGTYSTGNRITAFGSCTYATADSAGDVTSRTCSGQTATFKWTAESRLDTVIVGGQTIGYRYDAAGRLIRKDVGGSPVSYFLWDGDQLIAELSSPTAERAEYSYPLTGLDQPAWERIGGYTFDVHIDALGNVVAIATTKNNDGLYHVRAYGYDAWGGDASPPDTLGLNGADRARWKGALYIGTEAGLYYMRNRWYEPASGRFLSEDPKGIGASPNLYLFAGDDPVNGADPSGLDDEQCPTGYHPLPGTAFIDSDGVRKHACESDDHSTTIWVDDHGKTVATQNTPPPPPYSPVAKCPAMNSTFLDQLDGELEAAMIAGVEYGGSYGPPWSSPVKRTGTGTGGLNPGVNTPPPARGSSGIWHVHLYTSKDGFAESPSWADYYYAVDSMHSTSIVRSPDSLFVLSPSGSIVGCAAPM